MIQLTNLCNSKCKNCLIWTHEVNKNPDYKEVSVDEIAHVMSELKNDLFWVAFTGGEPTLKKAEIFELLKRAVEICPRMRVVAFTTNGLKPNDALEIALEIRKYNLDSIVTISMDGDEKTHDHIRGIKGNYQLALETYKLLRDHGVKVHYGLTVGKLNHDYIKEHYQNDGKNIKAITFTHMNGIYSYSGDVNSSRILDSLNIIMKSYKVEKLHEIIEFIYLKISKKFFIKKMRKNIIPCSVMKSTIDIMADGEVVPCMFLPKISDAQDFKKEMLFSEKGQKIIDDIKREKCPKCWMNCYAPHSIIEHPVKSVIQAVIN
ncbi:radical SAM domain protein [Bacteriovorax sp. Seq25_V]|nr:radical SAM domain protein [Bacteriovorax sp. Seq25_V]